MKKKLYLLLITLIFVFTSFTASCTTTKSDKIILPDLEYMSREEISEELDKLNITYFFKFANVICNMEGDYDCFVKYNSGLKAGDEISKDDQIYVYTTPLRLTINNLDKVSLTTDYEGKSFLEDGIGEVVLSRCIDGDTAYFYDKVSNSNELIKVRFLGIDTPESTREHDPWGEAASKYTKNILTKAKTIVLESEGAIKDTYNRYLAWVWADGKLVNLQIVQAAYSNSTTSKSSKYFDIMNLTATQAKKTGRRFYGEIDPDYNYNQK